MSVYDGDREMPDRKFPFIEDISNAYELDSHIEILAKRLEATSERIAKRIVRFAGCGYAYVEVRGGLFDILRTTHAPEVYTAVAQKLGDQAISANILRYHERNYLPFLPKTVPRDWVCINSHEGVLTQRYDPHIERANELLVRVHYGTVWTAWDNV